MIAEQRRLLEPKPKGKVQEFLHSSTKIGMLEAMFLILFYLKLAEVGLVAKLSWWWVTSPIWVPYIIALSVGVTVGVVVLIVLGFKACLGRKTTREE